jgi:hypothetical protein
MCSDDLEIVSEIVNLEDFKEYVKEWVTRVSAVIDEGMIYY